MLLQMTNLVKRYKDVLAVDNVSLIVDEGEIFGLLGPNGAGKTTTINAITGLTKADGGEITIFGKDIRTHEMAIKHGIGIVPQDIAVYEDLTVAENLRYFGRLYGLKGELLSERITEALEFTGLSGKERDYPKKFSGGMKRRLNIACAIVHHPKLIIMDEPTVGIDPQSRNHIMQSIKELNKAGSTIIYTSHYMEEVEELCTRLAIMDHGRVIARGTKDELENMVAVDERVSLELSSVNYTLVDNIRGISGVKECNTNGNQIAVVSRKHGRNLGRVIDCITETGTEILSLNIERPSLENVFLTLTGRSLRD